MRSGRQLLAAVVGALLAAAGASGAVVHAPVRPASIWRGQHALPRAQSLMAEQPVSLDFGFLSGPGLVGAPAEQPPFVAGDRVRVVATNLCFFHVPKHPKLNPHGFEGSVVRVYDYDKVSANLPVVVEFQEPRKFRAHFEPHELESI